MHNCETAFIPDRAPPTQFIDSLEDYEPGWSTLPVSMQTRTWAARLQRQLTIASQDVAAWCQLPPLAAKNGVGSCVVLFRPSGGWKCVPRSSRPYRDERGTHTNLWSRSGFRPCQNAPKNSPSMKIKYINSNKMACQCPSN